MSGPPPEERSVRARPPDDPEPRSRPEPPGNLPRHVTSFIGRRDELEKIRALLGRERLVTLVGAGGCGKTRLALAAATASEEFRGGSWWIDLAPLVDPLLVLPTVVSVLGAKSSDMESLMDALVRRLGSERTLLILDNCEHVVEACAELGSHLLRSHPDVFILATSREPLGVDGEISLRVPSLPHADATQLFIQRVAQVLPTFTPGDGDQTSIDAICDRLDGIPLAIELAAARARVLSLAQIAEGLADRFHLLTGGARTALPRQRTLEASLDWSYDLLDEPERILLTRLSVFSGTFDLGAAQAVGADGAIPRSQVLDLLTSLVDKSLVQMERPATHARYRMLETMRMYARQKLADAGEADEARTRHLAYFVDLAETAGPRLVGPNLSARLARLSPDSDNLMAAMDFALSTNAAEAAIRIGTSLDAFWLLSMGEGVRGEIVRHVATALPAFSGDDALRARALAMTAARSIEAAEECVAFSREIGDDVALQKGLASLGWFEFWSGRRGFSEHLEEAYHLAVAAGVARDIVQSVWMRAAFESTANGYLAGRALWGEAIDFAKRTNDPSLHASAYSGASWWPAFEGYLDEAERLADLAVAAARSIDSPPMIATTLAPKSYIRCCRGDFDGAARMVEEARSHSPHASGDPIDRVRIILALGKGDLETAAVLIADHLESWRTVGQHTGADWITCSLLWQAGWCALRLGNLAAARTHLDDALTKARLSGFSWNLSRSLLHSARLARALGRINEAEDLAHESLQRATATQDLAGSVEALDTLAGIRNDRGGAEEAARLFAASARVREGIGVARFAIDSTEHETDVASMRSALETRVFRRAWDEGAALTLGEAVTYVGRGRGKRKRPSASWASLTPVELEIVNLVAQGLSNPDIAARVFITRNTVKTHLQHVFTKLGVTSRSELAAEATRRRSTS